MSGATAIAGGPTLPQFLTTGVAAAAIVAVALYAEQRNCVPKLPMLLLVGEASYSLYLSHGFVLAIIRRGFSRILDITLAVTHALFIMISAIIAVVVSIALFVLLERPMTRWFTSRARDLFVLPESRVSGDVDMARETVAPAEKAPPPA